MATSTEGVAFQANFKTPMGTLLNVYAHNQAEFAQYFNDMSTFIGSIVEIEALINGANIVRHTPAPSENVAPAPLKVVTSQPEATGHTCQHGAMSLRSGEKNGKPWSGWFCTGPRGQQCPTQWGR